MGFTTISPFASGDTNIRDKLNQYHDNILSVLRFNDAAVILSLADDMNVSNTTLTEIPWDVKHHETGSVWGSGLPKRIIAPVAGIYGVIFNVEWRTSASGERTCGVVLSAGSVQIDLESQGALSGGGNLSGIDYIQMAANDYLIANVYHSAGSTIGIRGNGLDRTCIAFWLQGII